MAGHVFIVHGNLLRLSCDAWLMPCDIGARPEPKWLMEPNAPPLGWSWGQFVPWPAGQRVRRLTGWTDGPQPWLVDVGGDGATKIPWYVEGVRQFLAAAGTEVAGRPARNSRERPLLALPLVGTERGGAARRAGDVVVELLPALYDATREHDIDVALVTWSSAQHAAAQAARHALHRRGSIDPWFGMAPGHRNEAARLADRALAGELVLFIGAGISAGAGLPTWGSLLEDLARKAGLTPDNPSFRRLDFLDQAQLIERRMGAEALRKEITANLGSAQRYALAHALLAALPVREAVTTNYDRLFEHACEPVLGPGGLAVLDQTSPAGRKRWLLKLHGCVTREQDIVLVRADYFRYAYRRAAFAGIVQAMLMTRHMLFVGFSLDDLNFHRIVDDVRRAVGSDAAAAKGDHFGTVLSVERRVHVEELWSDELSWLQFGDEPASIPAAARRLDILLDHLGALTATQAHLLDMNFTSVLDTGDRELKRHLEELARDPLVRKSSAWPVLRGLLERLGWTAPRD